MNSAKGQKPFNSGLLSNFGDEGIIDNYISFFWQNSKSIAKLQPQKHWRSFVCRAVGSTHTARGVNF
jgi:hypothetical protein